MKASKPVFFCTQCGNESAKWSGQCVYCGAWNTLVEAPADKPRSSLPAGEKSALSKNRVKSLDQLDGRDELRFSTRIPELDRVLGGGAVRGSITLVGGAPGIGKSTLLLQLCGTLGGQRVLYVTGEESERQLKMRAARLQVRGENLYVLAETDIHATAKAAEELEPDVMIVDSIQTMVNPDLDAAPGSISQVKDCTMALLRLSKARGLTVFVVGHINKDGAIAGPKVLEHMVDCVLYFEGERGTSYRVIRAAKNRFGSVSEIGVFEMLERGLREVENPSELLLSGRPENAPGTCVTCVMEGSRPILAEVQALITPSSFQAARRTSNGIDYNRAMLLLAVLEKRGGFPVSKCDAYINVIGGLTLDDPAADLAAVLAIASSGLDKPVGSDLAAVGEVGLTGELRSVTELNQRLSEISRLGFKRCVVPKHLRYALRPVPGLSLLRAENIGEAIQAAIQNP